MKDCLSLLCCLLESSENGRTTPLLVKDSPVPRVYLFSIPARVIHCSQSPVCTHSEFGGPNSNPTSPSAICHDTRQKYCGHSNLMTRLLPVHQPKPPAKLLREQSSSSVILPYIPSHSPGPPAPVQMETLILITPSINFFFCCDYFLLPYSFCLGLRKSPVPA